MANLLSGQYLQVESKDEEQLTVRLYKLLKNGGFEKIRPQINLRSAVSGNKNPSASVNAGSRPHEHSDILLIAKTYINKRNKYQQTPLHFSAEIGDMEFVRIFLKAGAIVDMKDNKNRTPLHLSVIKGQKEIVKILIIAGSTVDARDNNNNTTLHYSAFYGYTEIVKILIKAGATIDAKDEYTQTPLHLSARNGHQEVVKILVAARADVNAEDKNRQTPLHLSANFGHKEVSKLLLKAGAAVDAEDDHNQTPLHLSANICHEELSEILIKSGASICKTNNFGLSFLDYKNGWQVIISADRSSLTITNVMSSPAHLDYLSHNSITTTVQLSETTYATVPAHRGKIKKSKKSASTKGCDNAAGERTGCLTSERAVCETEASGSMSSAVPSSERPHDLCDEEIPELTKIIQQIQDCLKPFFPNFKEDLKTTCSTDRKVTFQNGKIVVYVPEFLYALKAFLYVRNWRHHL